jgi:intracellular proteinase inhibitor BsuPI/flagellar hook capping protein FlgD
MRHLLLLLLLFTSCVCAFADYQNSQTFIDGTLKYTMSIDQYDYTTQDTVLMELKVKNMGDEAVTFVSPSSQEYDFELYHNNAQLWKWSIGMGFYDEITSTTVLPGDSLDYFDDFVFSEHPIGYTATTYTMYGYLSCYDNTVWVGVDFDLYTMAADEDQLEDAIVLANYPNPFNPETRIVYTLSNKTEVEILIYNSRGQLVKSVYNDIDDAGQHSLVWNGTDYNGNSCPSGIYLCWIKTESQEISRKMVLLK